jgi:activator of HSP90 ATPase
MSLKTDGGYELFGGNVRGKVQEVERPTKLVQTWQTRNGKWPSGESRLQQAPTLNS